MDPVNWFARLFMCFLDLRQTGIADKIIFYIGIDIHETATHNICAHARVIMSWFWEACKKTSLS